MTSLPRLLLIALLLAIVVSASGCAAVAGIFKAGVWVGVVVAVLVVAIVGFVVSRF